MADEVKSLGAALNEIHTDSDLGITETADEATEGTAGDSEDASATADTSSESDEGEGDETPEASGEDWTGEDSAEEDDETEEASTPFEELTPDQLKAIKESPELTAVYKGLMKSWTKRTQMAGEAMPTRVTMGVDSAGEFTYTFS